MDSKTLLLPFAAIIMLCLNTGFVNGDKALAKCGVHEWRKQDCFHIQVLLGKKMLFQWRYDTKKHVGKAFKDYLYNLVCACRTAAEKAGSTGFAITNWGLCYAMDRNEIRSLRRKDELRADTCYKEAEPFKKCVDGRDGDAESVLCMGDETAAYLYRVIPKVTSWGAWSSWSECKKCSQYRHRRCTNPAPGGGWCLEPQFDERHCVDGPNCKKE